MTSNINKSCYEFLKECTADIIESPAIKYNDFNLSYRALFLEIERLSLYLSNTGISSGDCVTIMLPNIVNTIITFYSLNNIGTIANFINPMSPVKIIINEIKESESKAVFIIDTIFYQYLNEFEKIDTLFIVCSASDYTNRQVDFSLNINNYILYNKAIESVGGKQLSPSENGDVTAVYIHGGGTTGGSKTIMLSSKALNSLAQKISLFVDIEKPGEECSLAILPFFHAFGLSVSMHFSLCRGFCCIPQTKFSAKEANNIIKNERVSFIAGVPSVFKKMYNAENFRGSHLQNLKHLFCGGDILNESFVIKFNDELIKYSSSARLMRGYGMSEVCSVCCANTKYESRPESVGKPIDGMKIRICGEYNRELPIGETGEIYISGSTMMTGYFGLENCIYTDKDSTKWIKSGDLGYMDSDGFLYFSGRKKRIIIISGFNVYPYDIELIAFKLGYVNEACAVLKNEYNKPAIFLYITLYSDIKLRKDEIEKSIIENCKSNLQYYSIPQRIIILNKMPKTDLGKIDYKALESLKDEEYLFDY